MAAVFSGAARTPISTLIMVAEMTGGYGLIVPAMLANISSFIVQRSLTHGRRYPTLYEAQVPTREDSPAHRGVFVRRALEMIEGGAVDTTELTLPRLVTLLKFGNPIQRVRRSRHPRGRAGRQGRLPLDGKTVVEAFGTLAGTIAVAILHGQEMIVPSGATRSPPETRSSRWRPPRPTGSCASWGARIRRRERLASGSAAGVGAAFSRRGRFG